MKQRRGEWSRGAWSKKTNYFEAANPVPRLKSLPMPNIVRDEPGTWTGIGGVEGSGSCWDSRGFDISFFDDNKKIFQWDDSGALHYLKKVECKVQQGISSVYVDYVNDSNQFLASIDWDERWICTLPDCAEEFVYRDEKRKYSRGISVRRESSDIANAVIFGLPEPQNDTGCSSTPSLHLPLHFVPYPTGWDDGEDSPSQPLTTRGCDGIQSLPPPQSLWNANSSSIHEPRAPESEWPECPSSYRHIIPSGWEDVQVYQPGVPLNWEATDPELRSRVQMRQVDIGGCYNPSDSCRPALCIPHPSSESRPFCGKAHFGKEQDNSTSRDWRPKRESKTDYHESSATRPIQRSGRSFSSKQIGNYNPRSPQTKRSDRTKPQWSSTDTLIKVPSS